MRPQYGEPVGILMDSMTRVGVSAATTWADRRREQRLQEALARLDQLENQALASQMEAQYARVDGAYAVPVQQQGMGWGNVAQEQPGATWGSVHDQAAAAYQPPADSDFQVPDSDLVMSAANAAASAAASAAANPWGSRYSVKGVPPVITTRSGEPAPLGLDVAVMKRVVENGVEKAVAIDDDAVLHDGHGRDGDGDKLRIYFSPSRDAYVYVVAVDAVARVQPLHPFEFPPAGPVPAGARVVLPSPSDWYGLDRHRGIQHVYLIASEQPLKDIESQLYFFASQPLPTPNEAGASVTEPSVLESDGIRSRGLTGVVPPRMVEVPSGAAAVDSVKATHFTADMAGANVLVTRFFRHQ